MVGRVLRRAACVAVAGVAGEPAAAQRRGSGAAKVVTAHARSGVLAPHAEFRGTVFFKEVSHVATEVNGKVTDVNFEEGDRVADAQLAVLPAAPSKFAGLRATGGSSRCGLLVMKSSRGEGFVATPIIHSGSKGGVAWEGSERGTAC